MPTSDLPTSREFLTQLLDSLRVLPPSSAHATNAATTNPLVNASEPVKKRLLALHVLFPNELLPALDLLDRRLVTRFCIRRQQDHLPRDAAPPTHLVATVASTASLPGHGPNVEIGVVQSDDDGTGGASKASAIDIAPTHAVGQTASSDTEMVDAAREETTSCIPCTSDRGIANAEEPSIAAAEQDTSKGMDAIYYVRSAQQRTSRYSSSYDTTTSYEVRLKAWNCSCPAFAFFAFPSVHPEPPLPVYSLSSPETTADYASSETTGEKTWAFGGLSLGDKPAPVCKHLMACMLAERCPALFGDFVEESDVSVEEAAGWAAGWGD